MKKGARKMLVSIGVVAEIFGVNPQTIRNWCEDGFLRVWRTRGGHRRFLLEEVNEKAGIEDKDEPKKTIIYSRVSSHDQKEDRVRQTEELKEYCKKQRIEVEEGEEIEVIEDLGSGLNYKKKGLKNLIKEIILGRVSRIVVTYKDRLLRFGTDLISYLCKLKNIEFVILHNRGECSYYEELAADVIAILTVFAGKIYGRRSHEKRAKKGK